MRLAVTRRLTNATVSDTTNSSASMIQASNREVAASTAFAAEADGDAAENRRAESGVAGPVLQPHLPVHGVPAGLVAGVGTAVPRGLYRHFEIRVVRARQARARTRSIPAR